MTVDLRVNKETHTLDIDPSMPLIYVLRNYLNLTGAKLGCASEQCGACAVLVDGESTLTCAVPVEAFQGRDIVTVEGLADLDTPGAVKRALVEQGAAQCGYCTPGIVIAIVALLDADKGPTEKAVREALSRHLCRCGSHNRVLAAVAGLVSG